MYKLPTPDELKYLTAELARLGVPFDEPIEKTASGFFGLCLIGPTKVLKLFRLHPFHRKPEHNTNYLTKSVKILTDLLQTSDKLTLRGINTPRIMDSGELPERINLAGNNYFGWYLMTRSPGNHAKYDYSLWSRSWPKLFLHMKGAQKIGGWSS